MDNGSSISGISGSTPMSGVTTATPFDSLAAVEVARDHYNKSVAKLREERAFLAQRIAEIDKALPAATVLPKKRAGRPVGSRNKKTDGGAAASSTPAGYTSTGSVAPSVEVSNAG